MSEKNIIEFNSSEVVTEEKEERERLQRGGGLLYEEEENPETKEIKKFVNILGVRIETNASEEEIEKIKEEIIFSKLDKMLLRRMAECYKLKQPLLIESDPGAGKTYLLRKFLEMIHGTKEPILQINGSPKMNELDILGHWAPNDMSEKEKEDYEDFLQKTLNTKQTQEVVEQFSNKLAQLNQKLKDKEITPEEFREKFGQLSTEYVNQQKEFLASEFKGFGKGDDKQGWHFEEGPLLKAYAGNENKGYPLIIDEFNLIPSNYQQIFLQISGQNGALSDSIYFWGDGKKTIYQRGENTWICFSSNFPEKTAGRSEVVAPMSDRLVWLVVDNEDFKEKKKSLLLTAGGRLKKAKKEIFEEKGQEFIQPETKEKIKWDKVLNEQLGEQIAEVVEILDSEFTDYYNKVGDSLTYGDGEERRRTQRLEFSSRNALRLFSYLDHFQVRNEETGEIDFTETLKLAFDIYYVSRLASEEGREKMKSLFSEVLEGDTGVINIQPNEGQKKELEKIFDQKNEELLKKLKKEREKVKESIKKLEQIKFGATDKNGYIKSDLFNAEEIKKDENILDLLGYNKIKKFEKQFDESKSKRLNELSSVDSEIWSLIELLKDYKEKFVENNLLKGKKTRREFLEKLVENYRNEGKEYEVPAANIDLSKIENRKELPPLLNLSDEISSGIDLDRVLVSVNEGLVKEIDNEALLGKKSLLMEKSLQLVFKHTPIEAFITNLGESNINPEILYSRKEIEDFIDRINSNQKKEEIKILMEESKEEGFLSFSKKILDKIKDEKTSLSQEIRDVISAAKTTESLRKKIGEILEKEEDSDISLVAKEKYTFLENCFNDFSFWEGFRIKLEKIEKLLENKNYKVPIVVYSLEKKEEILSMRLEEKTLNKFKESLVHMNDYFNSVEHRFDAHHRLNDIKSNIVIKRIIKLADIGQKFQEIINHENVIFCQMPFDVSQLREEVLDKYISISRSKQEILFFSFDSQEKKSFLKNFEEERDIKDLILEKEIAIVDANSYVFPKDNHLEENNKKNKAINNEVSRVLRFVQRLIDREKPVIIIAEGKLKSKIKGSALYQEMLKRGNLSKVEFLKSSELKGDSKIIKRLLKKI